jgi:antitoxin component of RelBE/YafQ-DinJ toxin-antitoxin module
MSEAINFFLWEGIKANDAPPEEYDQSNCNAETIAAFEEVEYMEAHPDEFNSYSSIKELHKEILAEMRADGEI